MKVTVGHSPAGRLPGLVPEVEQQLARGELGDKATIEREVDTMLTALREMWSQEPDQILRVCAALSARCTELCVHLWRVETDRAYYRVRTMQVERVLQEVERQAKIASRLMSGRQLDWNMSVGSGGP